MTIENWIKKSVYLLEKNDIPTAKLDTEVLLADILQKDRTWLHINPNYVLRRSDLRKLEGLVERRTKHEPIAYIRGKQEFYGRDFKVSPATLTPRPETETMIELLINQIEEKRFEIGDNLQIIDIGTGSGCIIVTIALELPSILDPESSIFYTGIDNSAEALKIAKQNAEIHKVDINFKNLDITKNEFAVFCERIIASQSDKLVVLANLPYVPEDFNINLAATHEPPDSIFGGKDGLDLYRILFMQLLKIGSNMSTIVYTESLPPQHKELKKIAQDYGFKFKQSEDFIQVFEK